MNDDNARTVLSEMIEITEQTIGLTFHRSPDLDALYRDCPSAFWLAPDDDGVLPPPPGPVRRKPMPIASDDRADPAAVQGLAGAIGRSLLVAGPIFAAAGMMLNRTEVDRHWWDPFARALVSLVALPLTTTVGALLALLPILIGVVMLGNAGTAYPAVRRPAVWVLTGGLMGVVIAALFDAGGTVALALVATSIACARIARTGIAWSGPHHA